ncbi:hypothetical protein DL93DRAFT_1788274 [Clavulina sp. PMI_390]|nr:hypothetical protein DL93DRAFT_1788274 [Clavulina sp. PMI_390]
METFTSFKISLIIWRRLFCRGERGQRLLNLQPTTTPRRKPNAQSASHSRPAISASPCIDLSREDIISAQGSPSLRNLSTPQGQDRLDIAWPRGPERAPQSAPFSEKNHLSGRHRKLFLVSAFEPLTTRRQRPTFSVLSAQECLIKCGNASMRMILNQWRPHHTRVAIFAVVVVMVVVERER